MAKIAALAVQRVEDRLDHQHIGAALDRARAPLRGRSARRSSKVMLRNAGSFTSGEMEAVRLVGPEHTRHQARPVGCRASRRRFRAPAARPSIQFADQMRQARNPPARLPSELKVLVSMMSAPARDIGIADLADDVGLGQSQKIVVALSSLRMIAEAGAAKIVLAQLVALDHHAPGAVEQQDALSRFLLHPGDAGGAVETHDNSFRNRQTPRIRHVA